MRMGRGAPAAGSRRHQRRKEAFPAPPTDRRRIFSGRRPRGRNGFWHSVQRETGERTRKAARPPFRLAASSENSAPRRLAGTEVRVSPPFREADASGSWFPQRRFRKAGRQLLHPVRPRGHSASPGAPDGGGPCLSADHSGNGNAVPRKAVRRKKIPTGGHPYREAVERLRTLLVHCVDEGDPVEILCARLGGRGGRRQRKLACGVRTAGSRGEFRRGSGCWRRRICAAPARTGETKMAEKSMKAVDADALRAESRKVRPERATYRETLEEMTGLLR